MTTINVQGENVENMPPAVVGSMVAVVCETSEGRVQTVGSDLFKGNGLTGNLAMPGGGGDLALFVCVEAGFWGLVGNGWSVP